jgi:flagellar motility protein MotE (MotC chaperone)
VLAGIFTASLILPANTGTAQVRSIPEANAQNLPDENGMGSPPPSLAKNAAVPSDALVKLLEERQLDLDRREAAVRRDEERLRLLRVDIEELIKKHEKRAKADASLVKGDASGPPVVHLNQVFESMPVEEAAQRIDKMSDAVALDLMSRLKSKTAGQILAAMNPTRAARLVEKLATERSRIPNNPDTPSERK